MLNTEVGSFGGNTRQGKERACLLQSEAMLKWMTISRIPRKDATLYSFATPSMLEFPGLPTSGNCPARSLTLVSVGVCILMSISRNICFRAFDAQQDQRGSSAWICASDNLVPSDLVPGTCQILDLTFRYRTRPRANGTSKIHGSGRYT